MSSDRCIPESSGTMWCGSLPAWLSSARCLSGFSNNSSLKTDHILLSRRHTQGQQPPKDRKKRPDTSCVQAMCHFGTETGTRPNPLRSEQFVSSTLNGLGGRKRPARKCKDGQLRGGQGSPVLTSCFNVPEAVSSRIFSDGSCAKL